MAQNYTSDNVNVNITSLMKKKHFFYNERGDEIGFINLEHKNKDTFLEFNKNSSIDERKNMVTVFNHFLSANEKHKYKVKKLPVENYNYKIALITDSVNGSVKLADQSQKQKLRDNNIFFYEKIDDRRIFDLKIFDIHDLHDHILLASRKNSFSFINRNEDDYIGKTIYYRGEDAHLFSEIKLIFENNWLKNDQELHLPNIKKADDATMETINVHLNSRHDCTFNLSNIENDDYMLLLSFNNSSSSESILKTLKTLHNMNKCSVVLKNQVEQHYQQKIT